MATAETAPKNPMRIATLKVKVTGATPKEVQEYFGKGKVECTKKGNEFVLRYTARGAAPNDIRKRLSTFTNKHEGAEVEEVEFGTENIDPEWIARKEARDAAKAERDAAKEAAKAEKAAAKAAKEEAEEAE